MNDLLGPALPFTILAAGGALLYVMGGSVRDGRPLRMACILLLALAGSFVSVGTPAGADGPRALQFHPVSAAVGYGGVGLALLFAISRAGRGRAEETVTESAGPPRENAVYGLLLLAAAGLVLAGMANDLLVVFLASEITGTACRLLPWTTGSTGGERKRLRAAGVDVLATLLLALGLGALLAVSGETRLPRVREVVFDMALVDGVRQPAPPLAVLAVLCVVSGLGLRIGLAPFRYGRAESFAGLGGWSAAVLACFSVATPVVLLIRLLAETLAPWSAEVELITVIVSAAALVVGNVLALHQGEVRRALGYTFLGHAGITLAALAAGVHDAARPPSEPGGILAFPGGTTACLVHLAGVLVATAGLGCVLDYLRRANGPLVFEDDFAGLVRRAPVASACLAVFLLTLAGVPPLFGFWGRLLVVVSVLSVHHEGPHVSLATPNAAFVTLALLVVLLTLSTVAVYLRWLTRAFFEAPVTRRPARGAPWTLAASLLAALLLVGGGLFPGPVLDGVAAAVSSSRSGSREPASTGDDAPGVPSRFAETDDRW